MENQSNDTAPIGKMILRYKYPDGRLTTMIAIGEEWQVVVFPTEEAAREFAAQHNLSVEEMRQDENNG